MPKNPELELALNFIEKTDRNLFITGKAGTGKTTFLHKIKNESLKRMVVVAPTGVAAINAKGVTIHSFFQLPFGPIMPNIHPKKSDIQRKFSKTKIDIIKSLDLVIIDEISMVRADVLDGIDQVLKRYKNKNKVFGGAQVVMIGDLQQLSPVVKPQEWDLLRAHYSTVYFFSSIAFQQANAIAIELKYIYRQKNENFITILNEIRNDTLSEKSAAILNERYNPTFSPTEKDGYITLTTHNKRAHLINDSELHKLKNKSYFFDAEISGKFNENSYPNSEKLELKVGAQVMFIKNDSSPEKRYFNGKIGIITGISKETVTVQCANEIDEIVTEREVWDNLTYSINEETKELKEDIVGSFSQIPLRLAWAITIHKSQGLTFEKAIIDAEASFAHGQTYVALSRCTSLEGIVLKTPIKSSAIINDTTVDSFHKEVAEKIPDAKTLKASEKIYHLNLIEELFHYQSFLYPTTRLIDIFYKNKTSLTGTIIEPLQKLKDEGIVQLMKVSHSFKLQLQQLAADANSIEKDVIIQERFKKAVAYFLNETEKNIKQPLEAIIFSTDNTAIKKDIEKQLKTIEELLQIKTYCFKALTDEFSARNYLKIRAKAVLQDPVKKKKKLKDTSINAGLKESLRALRNEFALSEDIPHFQVFTQKTLLEICEELPTTTKALLAIKGIGKSRVEKYGMEILNCVSTYLKKQKKKAEATDADGNKIPSKQISLNLFIKEGLSIAEIAKKRSLAISTIESHLASFIPTGEIDILELIDKNKFKTLKKVILKTDFKDLKELKSKLDDSFSYAEIKMMLSFLESESQ